MKDSQKKSEKHQFLKFIIGLAFIAAGLFALIRPDLVSGYLPLVIGPVAAFAGGFYSAIHIRRLPKGGSKFPAPLIKAVLAVVLALLVLIKPAESAQYLLLAMGVLFIVQALFGVFFALVMRAFSKGLFWIMFVPYLALLIIGLLLIIAPTALGIPGGMVIGIGLVLNGLLNLVMAMGSKKGKRPDEENQPSPDEEEQASS